MQPGNRTGNTREPAAVAATAVKSSPEGDGFTEIAVLSLAGLALSLAMIAHGVFADALSLMLAQ
jgi:hypothetical protein